MIQVDKALNGATAGVAHAAAGPRRALFETPPVNERASTLVRAGAMGGARRPEVGGLRLGRGGAPSAECIWGRNWRSELTRSASGPSLTSVFVE